MYDIDARHVARLNQENVVRLKRLRANIHGLRDEHERNTSDLLGVELETFLDFVIGSGYEDEPELDEDGKPVVSLLRTTPLHRTVRLKPRTRWRPTCRKLFKIYARLDLNYTDEAGLTHFHVACMSGCCEIVERFLELDQDPNARAPETGDTPLLLALANGARRDVVEALLRAGADPNLANEHGYTPLHFICQDNPLVNGIFLDRVLELFLEVNHDMRQTVRMDARDKRGRTPLGLALGSGYWQVVKILLRNGADPNAVLDTDHGFTPLHWICKRGMPSLSTFMEVCDDNQLTLQIDARDRMGNTPLHWALLNGEISNIERPMRAGADPSSASDYGSIPLHLALAHGQKKVAETLLKNGSDPNEADARGLTPLHVICKSYHDDYDD
uniref:Uncharacterized protein n=1 Tax=Trichogramma kaykai TaxID=54128 RepID=A0ABD2WH97_9HYME